MGVVKSKASIGRDPGRGDFQCFLDPSYGPDCAIGSLDLLEEAVERSELYWTVEHDPVISTLSEEPGFITLLESIERNIESTRAELGMPPASL